MHTTTTANSYRLGGGSRNYIYIYIYCRGSKPWHIVTKCVYPSPKTGNVILISLAWCNSCLQLTFSWFTLVWVGEESGLLCLVFRDAEEPLQEIQFWKSDTRCFKLGIQKLRHSLKIWKCAFWDCHNLPHSRTAIVQERYTKNQFNLRTDQLWKKYSVASRTQEGNSNR